jgi:hypothetical protein
MSTIVIILADVLLSIARGVLNVIDTTIEAAFNALLASLNVLLAVSVFTCVWEVSVSDGQCRDMEPAGTSFAGRQVECSKVTGNSPSTAPAA